MAASAAQRIDKWLWFARVVKTRSLAAALVEAGHVRLNRVKVTKPGHAVRAGDVLTIALDARVRVLKIRDFATRRGPSPEALRLYEDLSGEPSAGSKAHGGTPQKEGASGAGTC